MNTELKQEARVAPVGNGTRLAVETRNIHKAFGSAEVLRGMSIQIPRNSVTALLGPSGTGKSVLIQHMLGLLQPDEGEVLISGRSLAHMSRKELLLLRRDIGMLFQEGALFSSMSLYENISFPLRQHTRLTDEQVHDLVMHELQAVGLRHAAAKMPSELSGGMRKRAGLARALVMKPSILICDEPDSGLDPPRTAMLAELLLERHEEVGGTVIVVTHDIDVARFMCDHINVLAGGAVIASGTAEELFESDDPFVKQFLHGEPQGPLGMEAA